MCNSGHKPNRIKNQKHGFISQHNHSATCSCYSPSCLLLIKGAFCFDKIFSIQFPSPRQPKCFCLTSMFVYRQTSFGFMRIYSVNPFVLIARTYIPIWSSKENSDPLVFLVPFSVIINHCFYISPGWRKTEDATRKTKHEERRVWVFRPGTPGSNLYTSLSLLWMYVNTLYVPVQPLWSLAEPALHRQTVPSPAPPPPPPPPLNPTDPHAITSNPLCQHRVQSYLWIWADVACVSAGWVSEWVSVCVCVCVYSVLWNHTAIKEQFKLSVPHTLLELLPSLPVKLTLNMSRWHIYMSLCSASTAQMWFG